MRTRILAALAPLLASGCSLAPAATTPAPPVPATWPTGPAYAAQDAAQGAGLPRVEWQAMFRDARLQTVIEQALANNRDLRIAAANVAAARAQVRQQRAQQFPEIGIGAGVSRSDAGNAAARSRFDIEGGITAFELDLFGRLANATEAERQRALASEAAARTVRLGLMAELARAWASHAANAELLAIARDTAANARRSVSLTTARQKGGIAPRSDVRQAELILADAEADLASQTTALAQDRNLIDLLAGSPVDTALLPAQLGEALDATGTLPAGTRSEVLLRRPDIQEAEYRLHAASADIGVARAELFPRITLTGLLGLASDALGSLFTSGAFSASGSANARYAIFSGGGARAGVALSEAQRDAALNGYEKAIQTAFREVADALARQGTIADEQRAVANRVAASADNARLAEARYRGGIESFLANLDAQRALYGARKSEVAIRMAVIENRIALYRALGGD